MISRRNIRVKVMQTLYALEAQKESPGPGEAVRILEKHFDQTRQLLVYLVYFLTELARYAETDLKIRSSKHLPTEKDRSVNTKLAGNEVVMKIFGHASYQQALKTDKPQLIQDNELTRRLYMEMTQMEEYGQYIAEEGRDRKSERDILVLIFNDIMLANELFEMHVEEHFSNWYDDADMMQQFMIAYLNKPQAFNFQAMLSPEKWDFARGLLQTVIEKKEVTMDLIRPKLKNWDPERIATLDMILMQMGVCEFLYFETIPPKVTINEYIDLAKEYSTPQSGHFVNGILDNIHKDLVRDLKMHKVNYRTT